MHKHFAFRRLVALAVVTAATAAATLASPSPALAGGDHERIKNYQTWITATVDSIGNRPVFQEEYTGTTKSQWRTFHIGGNQEDNNEYVQFQNWYSGMCMDVGGTLLDGAVIEQNFCNSNDPTQWWFRIQDPDYPVYHIRNVFTGFYLSAQYMPLVPGIVLVQRHLIPNGDRSQMWQMW